MACTGTAPMPPPRLRMLVAVMLQERKGSCVEPGGRGVAGFGIVSRSALARVAAGTALAAGGAAALYATPSLLRLLLAGLRLSPELSGHGRSGHLALTFDDGPDP